ncbi:hypothetical protein NEOLEDRAFT_576079 [Neolentinus lepideus HHB14362 ss-1]|uniref:Membrane insertase YidC/Oxa/ALB C-terminal domain-containing protein n=1 Tax=Neolentinus lepideus HHB14362 ss-1 TaxID=1314782 RepID=A0A165QXB5_9AGAM|nr:hypothetical protein NEOLEDRAFT_576079 [Neolentinus lepideus HHB14362 ss-1]
MASMWCASRGTVRHRSSLSSRPSGAIHPLGIQSRRTLTVSHSRGAPVPSNITGVSSSVGPSDGLQSAPATPSADSSVLTSAASSTSDVVPPTDLFPDTAAEFTSLVPASIPPIQYGDLANLGLTSWSPIGLSVWALEIINTSTGLPWLQTIVLGTMLSRAIILPMSIVSMREAGKMLTIQPQLKAVRDEMVAAKQSQNLLQMQRMMLVQKSLFEEANVKPARMFLFNVMPLPVSLGMFFGVKRLCEFPLEQMKTGGLQAFDGVWMDLTVTDPTYILPVIVVGIINLQLRLAARDMQTQDRPEMLHMINAFHVFSILCSPLMFGLSVGMLFNIMSSVVFYAAQILLLRTPVIRETLKLPPLPQRVKLPSLWESFQAAKQWWANSVADAKAQAGRRK